MRAAGHTESNFYAEYVNCVYISFTSKEYYTSFRHFSQVIFDPSTGVNEGNAGIYQIPSAIRMELAEGT